MAWAIWLRPALPVQTKRTLGKPLRMHLLGLIQGRTLLSVLINTPCKSDPARCSLGLPLRTARHGCKSWPQGVVERGRNYPPAIGISLLGSHTWGLKGQLMQAPWIVMKHHPSQIQRPLLREQTSSDLFSHHSRDFLSPPYEVAVYLFAP